MTCKGWRTKYDVEDGNRSPEVNGNSCLGKRKKGRVKKQCAYLHEWLDKSYAFQQQPDGPFGLEDEPVNRIPSYRPVPCWPNQPTVPMLDRRLFPTVSEPAMCRYSMPVGYSLEPISLPVYTAYVPVPSTEPVASRRRSSNRPVRHNGVPSFSAPPPSHSMWQARKDNRRSASRLHPGPESGTNEEFTSLPPAATSHTPDTVRRRFSDPGIGRPPDAVDGTPHPCCSADSSNSSDTCSHASTPEPVAPTNGLVMSLMEQVNALQDSNKRLYKELLETKAELETLKKSWHQHPPEYQPGMLSDLVREIRDAARVREEVLLSRVCSMLEGAAKPTSNHVLSPTERPSAVPQKMENIEEQLQQLQIQREKTKPVTTQADRTPGDQDEVVALECENFRLRRSLQEAVLKTKDKESQTKQLERQVDVLRRKMVGVSMDEKQTSSEQSPSESLVSTVSSSSTTHSPQVTMSGPVTDL